MKLKLISLLLYLLSNTCFSQVAYKDISFNYGPHAVGFQHYTLTDHTRTYNIAANWSNQKIARPIPISIWYPASDTERNKGKLQVLDYMQILKEEEEWDFLPNDLILEWFPYTYENTLENTQKFQEKTRAIKDAATADGKFPVIIYAPSYQASSIENFALCEYLASQGYIVIASPSRGTDSKKLTGGTLKDLETQTRDMEFLLGKVMEMEQADQNKIATMGFSFGGFSSVLTQVKNDHIKAIVSLDGTIKYNYPVIQQSAYYSDRKVDVPFIHFSQKDIPEAIMEAENIDPNLQNNFAFYDSLKYSKAYAFKFNDLTHSCFSTLGVLFEKRDKRQDKPDSLIVSSYQWMCQYTYHFLNDVMNKDSSSHRFMNANPTSHKITKGTISKKYKSPIKKEFTFQDFHDLIAEKGYQNIATIFREAQKKNANFNPPEWKFNQLGLRLLYTEKKGLHSLEVFQFALSLFPDSANLWDSLGLAYLHLGNEKEALKSYHKSFLLNPENQEAKEIILKLKNRN